MRLDHAGRPALEGFGERYYPLDPTHPTVLAHRALALAILADYNSPTDPAERVSAIMDWIARTAIHGHSGLRQPTPYTRGTATLPAGETWATVQAKLTGAQQETDNAYWATFNHDAAVILSKLLGSLQPDGTRADDGAMVRVTDAGAQAHYRYRDLASVRSVWCSWQHDIATLLLATLGYPSMLANIAGHDPLRVQYGERGEWGYWCSTYNEHYRLQGRAAPLDLTELRDLTQAGRVGDVVRATHTGPVWDPAQYVSGAYIVDHPDGWPQIGSTLDSRIVPGKPGARLSRVHDDPALEGSGHPLSGWTRVSERTATPYLGAYVLGLPVQGVDGVTVRVASGWPGTTGFVVRREGGDWMAVRATVLPGGERLTVTVRARREEGLVEVAPVDTHGQRGPAVGVRG